MKTTRIDSFAALAKAVKRAGQAAREVQGRTVEHPMFTTMAIPAPTWTCGECQTVVTGVVTEREPFGPCQCMAEAEDAAQSAERGLHLPYVIEREWERAGIPPLLRNSTLENFVRRQGTGKALKVAREYVQDFEPHGHEDGLLFYGPPGAGKSRLAVAVARAIMETYLLPVVFYTAADLVDESQRFRFGRGSVDAVDRAVNAPLLILDDLGNQNVTPDAREQVYLVVDRRYRKGAPMIITSNLNDGDLAEAMGQTMASRILEVCRGVKFTATDYRKELRRMAQGGADTGTVNASETCD